MESGSFLVRSAAHVALDLALRHLESLGVSASTPLGEVGQMLSSESKEASLQTAYLSDLEGVTLVSVVEAFLAAKAREKTTPGKEAPRDKGAWRTQTTRAEATSCASVLQGTHRNFLALEFAAQGLVAAASDKSLQINNESSTVHSPILALAAHPTRTNILATVSMDGSCSILDSSLPTPISVQLFRDHAKYVSRVAFSPSGEWLVSAGYDWKVCCYKYSSAKQEYELVHSIHFLGAVESLAFLPSASQEDSETFCVGSRTDSNLHFITLTPQDVPGTEPLRQRCSMNRNGDDWISFTPMDISIVSNTRSSDGLDAGSWTMAVYTDLPSGKLCLYDVGVEFEGGVEKLTREMDSMTVSATSDKTQVHVDSPLPRFSLRWKGDCFGVVADAFSRPRCLLLQHESRLVLAATSDDSKVILFDTVSASQNSDGIARKVGELVGHTGLVRSLCLGETVEKGVCVYTGSFDSTVRLWTVKLQ
ncbi:hypothetical protein HDU98_000251 [Podochytrium sp. JEL0797]|nr:hypothetical protein HDU98_000251 [Podochytrium sp. JEL0797]